MKRKHICIIGFILLLIMLVSCGGGSDPIDAGDTNMTETTAADTQAVDIDPVETHNIEKDDYGSRDFVVLYPYIQLYRNFLFSDQISGDIVSDTIYQRDQDINEYLNINIKEHQVPNWTDYYQPLLKSVQAGDSSFDLFLTHCHGEVLNTVKMNLSRNWNQINYVDLSKSYWNQEINEMLEFSGALPLAVNDFIIPDVSVFFFNKEMAQNYELEDIYTLVREGNFTFDKVLEMSQEVIADLNGDGTFGQMEDQVGLYTMIDWQLASYGTAADIYVASKKGDDLELTLNTTRTLSFIDKLHTLLYTELSYTWANSAATDLNQGGISPVRFEEGRSLFALMGSTEASVYRNAELDFGIIPIPKLDDKQENYRCLTWSGFMGVPQTASDPDLVGKVAELLGYYNKYNVMPEFYNKQLVMKVARDDQSAEMLDIIYGNIVLDFGIILSFSSMAHEIIKQNENFTSYYEKNEPSWQKTLNDYAEAFSQYAELNQ